MLIDVPEVSRTAFRMQGVYPTHPGAETLYTDLADDIDRYSQEYAKLADAALLVQPRRPVRKVEDIKPKPEKKTNIIRRKLQRKNKVLINGD
jgi:hypothetical protein